MSASLWLGLIIDQNYVDKTNQWFNKKQAQDHFEKVCLWEVQRQNFVEKDSNITLAIEDITFEGRVSIINTGTANGYFSCSASNDNYNYHSKWAWMPSAIDKAFIINRNSPPQDFDKDYADDFSFKSPLPLFNNAFNSLKDSLASDLRLGEDPSIIEVNTVNALKDLSKNKLYKGDVYIETNDPLSLSDIDILIDGEIYISGPIRLSNSSIQSTKLITLSGLNSLNNISLSAPNISLKKIYANQLEINSENTLIVDSEIFNQSIFNLQNLSPLIDQDVELGMKLVNTNFNGQVYFVNHYLPNSSLIIDEDSRFEGLALINSSTKNSGTFKGFLFSQNLLCENNQSNYCFSDGLWIPSTSMHLPFKFRSFLEQGNFVKIETKISETAND